MLHVDRVETEEVMDIDEAAAAGEVDLANALDLSESEEEEELEDLIEDFALQADQEQVCRTVHYPSNSATYLKVAGFGHPTREAVFLPISESISNLCFKSSSTRSAHGC